MFMLSTSGVSILSTIDDCIRSVPKVLAGQVILFYEFDSRDYECMALVVHDCN